MGVLRPIPAYPRGPRRARVVRERLLLGCPRVSPEWELAALRTLMKPQAGGRIAHRHGLQRWTRRERVACDTVAGEVRRRIDFGPGLEFPADGDYRLIVPFLRGQLPEARGLAVALSKRLPGLWFTCDRTFVFGGQFYRRKRGHLLELVLAKDIHVPAGVRAALREVIG